MENPRKLSGNSKKHGFFFQKFGKIEKLRKIFGKFWGKLMKNSNKNKNVRKIVENLELESST